MSAGFIFLFISIVLWFCCAIWDPYTADYGWGYVRVAAVLMMILGLLCCGTSLVIFLSRVMP